MAEEFNIAELVDRLGRFAHALQFTGGLNPAQWEALRFLARANRYSSTPSALAEYLGTTKGTVSQTLIALESKGYLRRTRARFDGRSVELSLTEAGSEMLQNDPIGMMDRVGQDLPAAVRHALADGLTRLLASLNKAQGSPNFGICTECDHLHPATDESSDFSPCKCGLTSETLKEEDIRRICINFAAAQTQ